MSARTLIALAVLVVALALAATWWFVRSEASVDGLVDAPGARASSLDATTAELDADERDGADGLAASNERRERGADATSRLRNSVGARIRLVDARTGAALPGASLRCDALPRGGGIERDSAEFALESADILVADASGSVQLPVLGEGFAVAHTTELWGYALWRKGAPPPEEIRLEPDPELRVQCLDEDGRPVIGVPLAFRAHGARAMHGDGRVRRTRAPDGVARFNVRDLFAEGAPKLSPALRATIKDARLAPDVHALELSLGELAGALHALRVPATSRIDVAVVDPEGRPAPDGVEVLLRTQPYDPGVREAGFVVSRSERDAMLEKVVAAQHAPPASPLSQLQPVTRTSATTRNGRASFDVAGGTHTLYAEAWRTGIPRDKRMPRPSAKTSIAAPRHGAALAVELTLGRDWLVVRGRAIDGEGKPHALMRVHACGVAGAEELIDSWADAQGRFEIELNGPAWDGADRAWIALTGSGFAPHGFALPDELRGPLDLGDVSLPAIEPQMLRFVVLGTSGAPVTNARVFVARASGGKDLEQASSDEYGRVAFEVQPEWGPVLVHADGSQSESLPLALNASDPQSCAREHELTLLALGTVVGRIDLPPGARRGDFFLRCGSSAAPVHAGYDGFPIVFDDEGRFETAPLVPAPVSFWVHVAGIERPVVSATDVAVELARRSTAPSIDPLRVTGVRLIDLRVVDAAGAAVSAPFVAFAARDARHSAVFTEGRDGRVRQWLLDGSYDASIQADGFASAELTDLRGDERVVLGRALTVTLELAIAPELDDPALPKLYVGLARADAPKDDVKWGAIGDDRCASFDLAGPGRYRVLCCYGDRAAKPADRQRALDACPLELEIDRDAAERPIVIPVRREWWIGPPPPKPQAPTWPVLGPRIK